MTAEIIPPGFFEARSDLVLWLLTAGSVALLVYGADRTVSAAAKLAAALGMSKVIIGATVVSLGTTSPEAAVSVNAALQGDGGLALGNGVGSIICDTALVFGLCCCLTRLPKDRFVLSRHGWLQFGSGVLLAILLGLCWAISGDIDQVKLPRLAGVGLLILLVGYMYVSVRWSRQHAGITQQANEGFAPSRKIVASLGNSVMLVFGLVLVVGGSDVLIGSVKQVCQRHDVSETVIAATVVAFGTSLPELVTAIAALAKGHGDLLVGNVIGADILNVLFVIGASATAVPLDVDPRFYWFMVPTMLVALGMLRIWIFLPGDKFQRWQGVALLAVYVGFVVLSVKFGAEPA